MSKVYQSCGEGFGMRKRSWALAWAVVMTLWNVGLTFIMWADWNDWEKRWPSAYHVRQVAKGRAGSQAGDLAGFHDWYCHAAVLLTGHCPDERLPESMCEHYHADALNPLTGRMEPLIGEP